jgi:hypothetical protein
MKYHKKKKNKVAKKKTTFQHTIMQFTKVKKNGNQMKISQKKKKEERKIAENIQ